MRDELKVAQKLIDRKKTLSLAESCTGGLLAHLLTNIPGSSAYLHCGIVCYSNASKIKLLKIPERIIKNKGAVSSEVAILMAKNVRTLHNSDFGIGITGIAGPDGGSRSKPVGLTYIAAASSNEALCIKCIFNSDRQSNKKQAAIQALKLLYEIIC